MGSDTRSSPAALNRVVVRSASGADLADVVALERACYGDPWPASAFASLPANQQVFFSVARDAAGKLAGYVIGWYVMDEGELANLAVAPDLRSQGIGRLLLEAILQDARIRGTRQLYLEVRESNAAARQLYLANGFEEVGRRKRYYRRPTEDALILRRTLNG
jgi:ribosomal-protein-alanine N-acetyltransferase